MVYDNIKNAQRYAGLGERIAAGLNAIQSHIGCEPGKYEIDGDNVFLLVQHYNTAPVAEKKWETHQKYIDIQYIEDGNEWMGYTDITNLSVDVPYDENNDAELYTGEGAMLPLQTGDFVILYAGEPHMPGATLNKPAPVRKIIAKIKA